jgi:hypothetical protein
MLTDYIKIQVQQAMEDYELAIKQDIVYEAVEQASENYRIIKDKYDTAYQTLMITRCRTTWLSNK